MVLLLSWLVVGCKKAQPVTMDRMGYVCELSLKRDRLVSISLDHGSHLLSSLIGAGSNMVSFSVHQQMAG